MRAALFLSVSFLACGGRTLPDSGFDEPFGGTGGSLAGGNGRGGSPNTGQGGQSPRAGSPSAGGAPSVGGAPAAGSFSKGGTFTGGAPSNVLGECKSFCVSFDRVCPNTWDFNECFAGCASAGATNRCAAIVREATSCFNRATRGLPSGSCGLAQQAIALNCRSQLEALGGCGFGLSSPFASCQLKELGDATSCHDALLCTELPIVREFVCTPDGQIAGGSSCLCTADGEVLFLVETSLRGPKACAESREDCWKSSGF